jgi:siroheme synthase
MTKIATVRAIEVAEEADSIIKNQINSPTIIVFCNEPIETN